MNDEQRLVTFHRSSFIVHRCEDRLTRIDERKTRSRLDLEEDIRTAAGCEHVVESAR